MKSFKAFENKDEFTPHMMYDPKTKKGYKAKTYDDHMRMKKMGYVHDLDELSPAAMKRRKRMQAHLAKTMKKYGLACFLQAFQLIFKNTHEKRRFFKFFC